MPAPSVTTVLRGIALLACAAAASLQSSRAAAADEIDSLNSKGVAAHDAQSLREAAGFYRKALDLDPPRAPTAPQMERVLRFAPRLFTVAGEFFPLKDVVAVVHPDRPVIGYHLFWEDDIDFPADNEPADHEIVWIEYDPDTLQVTKVSAYLHTFLNHGEGAPAEANANGGRAWIGVEWGKHGSLAFGSPDGSEGAGRLLEHNWTALHTKGRQRQDHPLARGWPLKFEGDLAAYKNFLVPVDPVELLRRNRLVYVSRLANATINQYCLRYNFAPKMEWPWLPPVRR